MARSNYDLINRIYDGKLADRLSDWRTDGLSFDDMAIELRNDDITVTGETVRAWCIGLGLHTVTKVKP